MKYEIITDSEDLLVLTVNSRVICISHDMSEIVSTFTEDYDKYMDRKIKAAEKVKEVVKEDNSAKNTADPRTLGELFNI